MKTERDEALENMIENLKEMKDMLMKNLEQKLESVEKNIKSEVDRLIETEKMFRKLEEP